jgi:hypothetical protein
MMMMAVIILQIIIDSTFLIAVYDGIVLLVDEHFVYSIRKTWRSFLRTTLVVITLLAAAAATALLFL